MKLFEHVILQFSVELAAPPPSSILHELFHSGANAGATTCNPGTLLFNNKKKVIFVFLYLNICYLNYMLVSCLTIHQQQYLYFREGLISWTGPHTGSSQSLVDRCCPISKVRHFFKDLLNVSGFFAHINVKLLLRNRILWVQLCWWIC